VKEMLLGCMIGDGRRRGDVCMHSRGGSCGDQNT
jgi:hypothetical protein